MYAQIGSQSRIKAHMCSLYSDAHSQTAQLVSVESQAWAST